MFKVYPVDVESTSAPLRIGSLLDDARRPLESLFGGRSRPFSTASRNRERELLELMAPARLSTAQLERLRAACAVEPEPSGASNAEIADEALALETARAAKEVRARSAAAKPAASKYRSVAFAKNKREDYEARRPDLVPGREVLVRIKLYDPWQYNCKVKPHHRVKFCHDVVLLGSQTLDALCDQIRCPNEYLSVQDMSEDPDIDKAVFLREVYKSGFFFIEGTFYNDMRNPENLDYSECIRKWAKDKKDVGPFKTARMETTRFDQLTVHLGYPQVFQHLGSCEHVFVFSDVEVLQPSDVCHSSHYPYCDAMSLRNTRYCIMCGVFSPRWLCVDNPRVPFEPSVFCDACFKSYNYKDGQKIGDFKAFPYFDRSVLV